MADSDVVDVQGLTNEEFFAKHAAPGRVGLVGTAHWIDSGIKRAQRPVKADRTKGEWSHAFIFEGTRLDNHQWILESDLDMGSRSVRFGVQENRISKYYDEETYPCAAVIDFRLTPQQVDTVLRAGLQLLGEKWKYSIRELLGTLVALPSRRLRARPNLLAKEHSLYCSAFVQHLFLEVGMDFAPDADEKNTTPEHISSSPLPKTAYLVRRAGKKARKASGKEG